MKKILAYFLYTLSLSAIVCACNDGLDIQQDYRFDLVTMPVQKKIVQGETAVIQCQLVKEGNYDDARFSIRYFQPDGVGELRMEDGTVLLPNDLYPLDSTAFRLYYTSQCTDQQTVDVYIEDSFGQVVQKSFGFTNENAPEEEPVDYGFTFTSLPVLSQILLNDTVEIRCRLAKADECNKESYSIRYFQPKGKGGLILNDIELKPNELYKLNDESFNLYYISDCEERQTIDVYIVDSRGQTVQQSFSFENIPIEQAPEVAVSFELVTLPVPKKIAPDETIEIRCRIKKADERNTSSYSIRYFQPDGKGELRFMDGTLFYPNDLYSLGSGEFRLYYISRCSEPQVIDVYIEDDFGQVVQKTFSWQSANGENGNNEVDNQ